LRVPPPWVPAPATPETLREPDHPPPPDGLGRDADPHIAGAGRFLLPSSSNRDPGRRPPLPFTPLRDRAAELSAAVLQALSPGRSCGSGGEESASGRPANVQAPSVLHAPAACTRTRSSGPASHRCTYTPLLAVGRRPLAHRRPPLAAGQARWELGPSGPAGRGCRRLRGGGVAFSRARRSWPESLRCFCCSSSRLRQLY